MEHAQNPAWYKQTKEDEDQAERGLERWVLWLYYHNKDSGFSPHEDALVASLDLCILGPGFKTTGFRAVKHLVSCG